MRGSAVQREDRPQVGLELPGDRLRGEDLYRGAETSEPGEELRAWDDLHGDGKAGRGGDKDLITAETVKDLCSIEKDHWMADAAGIEEFYAKFGSHLPKEMANQLEALKERLAKM